MNAEEEFLKSLPRTEPLTYKEHDEFSEWFSNFFHPTSGLGHQARSIYWAALEKSYYYRDNPDEDVEDPYEDPNPFPVYMWNFTELMRTDVPKMITTWKDTETYRQKFVYQDPDD
jgi:hypothetical protein